MSVHLKRKRSQKKKEEHPIVAKSKNRKESKNKKMKKKNGTPSHPLETPVPIQFSCTRTTDVDPSSSMMLRNMVKDLLRNAFLKSGLKMKLSSSATMTPVIHLPVSVRSNEWKLVLPLLQAEEYRVFSSTKRGYALTTWARTDCVLNELCYKLDVSGDLAIICPITCISESNRKCFVIKEEDQDHYQVFIPIKASTVHVVADDPYVSSPFNLGFRLKGTLETVLKTDVGVVHPITLGSVGTTGKVEISGKLTTFGKSGYYIFGLLF